jgi:hypothetical protein
MSIKTTTYGFIPTQVAGCSLWLDGADPAGNGVIPANGDSITTWVDKSGLGNNATGGVSPTFNTSGINNKGTVSFNGTNSYLNSADLFSNRSFSIFIIIRRQASISSQTGILAGTQFNTNMNLHFVFRSSTNLALGFYANDLDYVSFTNYTGNSATEPAYLIQATYISGTRILYVNGNQVASDANTTNLSSQVGALIGQYNGTYYNGFIGEICILNGTPNTTSRQQIEAYLAQKWGLTSSLPIGHPGLTTTVYQSSYLKTAGVKTNIATMTPFYKVFAPRQIAGCSLWLDGADPAGNGVIPANGASIATWVDKSGLGQTITQATTANQALYTSGGGLTFTSGMQYPLNTSVFMTMFSVAYTIFVVEKRAVSGLGFFIGNTAGGGGPLYLGYNGTTVMRFTTASIVDLDYTVPAYSGSDATEPIRIWACRWFGSSVNSRDIGLNGQLSPLTQAFNQAPSFSGNQSIGGCLYGNYVGKMYEMIIFNKAISDSAKQQVESYLAQKWGLTSSLPGAHLNATQPAGAVTSLSLTNSKMTLTKFGVAATGGTVTTANGYKIHTFTSVGSTNFVVTSGGSVQVLVVGGGGAGGGNVGGGGGAGGAVFNSAFSLSAGTYSVTVGNGGAIDSGTNQGQNGGSSSFSNITVVGGGAGGVYGGYAGLAGACGGGAGNNFTFGTGSVGFNGGATSGICGGGGGGMGSVGTAGSGYNGGAGGAGATYTIGGQSYTVCGGGGGAGYNVAGTNGVGGSGGSGGGATGTTVDNNAGGTNSATPNSGGGGAGGTNNGNDYASAGASGIVIIAYKV